MQRVMVIGSPGAGKSTFARAIAERLGLPLIHLDAEYWQAGWVEPPADEWRGRVVELVAGDVELGHEGVDQGDVGFVRIGRVGVGLVHGCCWVK